MGKGGAGGSKIHQAVHPVAQLDLQEKRTEDAAAIAGKAVAMNPLEFPELYFLYAAANYNLKHFDLAETNARRATELDSSHEVPRAEVLLGTVLIAKGDRAAPWNISASIWRLPRGRPTPSKSSAPSRSWRRPAGRRSKLGQAYLPCTSFMTPDA